MKNVAKTLSIGIGVCYCHSHPPPSIPMTGFIITGSNTTSGSENIQIARTGSIMLGSGGHVGMVLASATNTTVDGINMALIGDNFIGCFTGIIIKTDLFITAE